MKLCYIDESGDGRRPDPQTANVTPLFVICSLMAFRFSPVDGGSLLGSTYWQQCRSRLRLGAWLAGSTVSLTRWP